MAERSRGLPGLAGGEHIGITVPDVKQAVDFLIDAIGCDFVFDGGELSGDPELMRTSLALGPRARMKCCFLRCGNGLDFEVFEYAGLEKAVVRGNRAGRPARLASAAARSPIRP